MTVPINESTVGLKFAYLQVPPKLARPPGFDPRRGHLVDPSSASSAPPGWQFWVSVAPQRRPMSLLSKIALAIGILMALGAAGRLIHTVDAATTPSGVGSCWTAKNSTGTITPVRCSDRTAHYTVVSEVASEADCPAIAVGTVASDRKGYWLCLTTR